MCSWKGGSDATSAAGRGVVTWHDDVACAAMIGCSDAACVVSRGKEGHQLSLPKQVDKLLVSEDCCKCDLEWHCVPHDACFIHDSCFCEGSGSFPPVTPPHSS